MRHCCYQREDIKWFFAKFPVIGRLNPGWVLEAFSSWMIHRSELRVSPNRRLVQVVDWDSGKQLISFQKLQMFVDGSWMCWEGVGKCQQVSFVSPLPSCSAALPTPPAWWITYNALKLSAVRTARPALWSMSLMTAGASPLGHVNVVWLLALSSNLRQQLPDRRLCAGVERSAVSCRLTLSLLRLRPSSGTFRDESGPLDDSVSLAGSERWPNQPSLKGFTWTCPRERGRTLSSSGNHNLQSFKEGRRNVWVQMGLGTARVIWRFPAHFILTNTSTRSPLQNTNTPWSYQSKHTSLVWKHFVFFTQNKRKPESVCPEEIQLYLW